MGRAGCGIWELPLYPLFLLSTLLVVALLLWVRKCSFYCGQTVRADVLLISMSRGLVGLPLVEGLAGLRAGPGSSVVSSLALA